MANIEDDCKATYGPVYHDDDHATQKSCVKTSTGVSCPTDTPADVACKPWQLTASQDSCYADQINAEALAIAGADLFVYKLNGVHEQAKLVDATGKGKGISGGALPGFPADNAFTIYDNQWKSIQSGATNIIASSFIGYDFGEIKTSDGKRNRYGVDTACRKHIMAFAIKQSSNPKQRVTKARLERSEDGMKWYGVHVVNLPDDDCFNTILSRHSVQTRMWRLRPLEFTGDVTDRWSVVAFQMYHDYDPTHEDNIQDKIFLENRNRDYDTDALQIKGSYDLVDVQSELTRFGIELPSQTIYATVNFKATVAVLGRPLIVGDIIRMPSETQYNLDLEPVEKWMEITDTSWSTEGYTPGWVPTLMRIVLQPAYASEETQDLFGDLHENAVEGGLGLVDKAGHHPIFQDYSTPSQEVQAEAKNAVPERGQESSSVFTQFTDDQLTYGESKGVNMYKLGQNPKAFQAEDAMPPNNDPYTEGDELPTTGKNGDWHRLTYTAIHDDLPARLYRYSETKNRWIYMEKDRRGMNNSAIPILQEFLDDSEHTTSNQQLTRKDC